MPVLFQCIQTFLLSGTRKKTEQGIRVLPVVLSLVVYLASLVLPAQAQIKEFDQKTIKNMPFQEGAGFPQDPLGPDLGKLTPEEIEKGRTFFESGAKPSGPHTAPKETNTEKEPRSKETEKRSTPNLPEPESAEEVIEKPESGSPFERYIARELPKSIPMEVDPFGYNLFEKPSETFEPVETIPVGPDYHLGPGDEVRITLWGKLNADLVKPIDRDGKIVLPQLGAVHLSGLTFSEAKTLIEKEFSRYYKSSEVKMNISMGQLRTIPVFVVGKVARPGRYTLSSFSTLINALFASGGPSMVGSMRNIQLRRNGEIISRFDVYDLLLKGKKEGDVQLMAGDIIFIPTVGPRVGISGDVKVPALYELKRAKTLTALIDMAGGVTETGDLKKVQVERVFDQESKVVLDVNLGALQEIGDIELKSGDFVKVFSIDARIRNAVTLKGNVVRPGLFEWREGMRIGDLFKSPDDFLPETFLEFALIERIVPPDYHKEYLSVPLGELMIRPEIKENIPLQPEDKIVVFNQWDLMEKKSVQINGSVNQPGVYEYRNNMKLSDLFKLAGGLKRPDHPESYLPEGIVVRKMPPDFHEEKIPFSVVAAVVKEDADADFLLHPLDEVHLFDEWGLSQEKIARVVGAVNSPGDFPLAKNMRIKDLLSLAGGTKYYAYKTSAELTRIVPTHEGPSIKRIDINLEDAIAGHPEENILLEPDDYLAVQAVPEWELYRIVKIEGEVRFPGVYTSMKGERLSSLIKRAGGLTENAYLKGAVFTRKSVQALQQQQLDDAINRFEQQLISKSAATIDAALSPEAAMQHQSSVAQRDALLAKMRSAKAKGRMALELKPLETFEHSSSDVVLEEGDVLMIPERPQQVQVIGAVFNQTAFIYEGETTVTEYLKKAGGMTENANDDALYVLKVDGTAFSKQQTEGFWFWKKQLKSSTLDPGDTIVVPERLDKIAWLRGVKDITQILYQMAVTAGVLIVAF